MARATVHTNSATSVLVPRNTTHAAVTTAITAVGTARTSAAESNAGVTTAIAAVQTLVTALDFTFPAVVDVDLAILTTRKKLEVALATCLDQICATYGLK